MKVLICDLDKTLLPYGGVTLENKVIEKLLLLQQQGMRIILASARLAGGVFPIAKQLQMHKYHGFIIANNGSFLYDLAQEKILKGYEIPLDVCDEIVSFTKTYDVNVAFEQGSYTVVNDYDEGIAQDRINCSIDVIIAQDIKKHIKFPIYKCSISGSKETLDEHINDLKHCLSDEFDIFRSTDTFLDVLKKGCSKEKAVKEVLDYMHIPASESVAFGDGNSDALMIKEAGLGVTLENGSDLCKQYADMIVPSCYDMGCITLFDYLLDKE